MKYAQESAALVLDEIKPLLELHWQEVAAFKDVPLAPNYDAYMAAEATGKLRVFTARVDAVLVGYAIFFLGNLHYATTAIATQDILFLHPAYRGRGARLIMFCDEALGREGIQVVLHHTKIAPALDFSPLLKRLGYEEVDRVLARRLPYGR